MSVIGQFRVVRAPRERILTESRVVRAFAEDDQSEVYRTASDLAAAPPSPVPVWPFVEAASQYRGGPRYVSASEAPPKGSDLDRLWQFEAWLAESRGERSPDECRAVLQRWAHAAGLAAADPADAPGALTGSEWWPDLRGRVFDSLIAATITERREGNALRLDRERRLLMRLAAAIGLIELLTSGAAPATAAEIAAALNRRTVVLPPWIVAARRIGGGEKAEPLWVRRPAFTDHFVVRDEWSCYVPGDIAHIENVLKGEEKVRLHRRLDETETTQITEEVEAKSDERDTQTTDRSSFQDEVSRQTSLAIGVEAQVDVKTSFGPTEVETHLGGTVDYSTSETQRRASEQAREIVDRAVSRVEQRVTTIRKARTLRRVTETNKHRLDNTQEPEGHVVGIYRWVDKVQRLQLFRYPHRFVLEFQIPEPAAYVRWLDKNAVPPELPVGPPPEFTIGEGAAKRPLTADDVTRDEYLGLAARYRAIGVRPPPAAETKLLVAVNLKSEDMLPENLDDPVRLPPTITKTFDFALPDGYRATGMDYGVSFVPVMALWRDYPAEDGGFDELEGYHTVGGSLRVGDQEEILAVNWARDWTVHRRMDLQRGPSGVPLERVVEGWHGHRALDITPVARTEKMQGVVLLFGTIHATVSMQITCALLPAAFQQWQLETYERLLAAYREWKQDHDDAVAAQRTRAGVEIRGRNPLRNQQVVREELKRQVLEMLTGEPLVGYDLVAGRDEPAQPVPAPPELLGPETRLLESVAAAPLIQFLEQCLEWTNITYIHYPYYWAPRNLWAEAHRIDDPDGDYATFLRSGSTRVVVPVRPGFEWAVAFYAVFDEPWMGGPAPAPDHPLYLSVAQEIMEMKGAPDEGEPGALWETRLPTTLVWLDDDSGIPKHNEHRRLVGEPLIDICGQ